MASSPISSFDQPASGKRLPAGGMGRHRRAQSEKHLFQFTPAGVDRRAAGVCADVLSRAFRPNLWQIIDIRDGGFYHLAWYWCCCAAVALARLARDPSPCALPLGTATACRS